MADRAYIVLRRRDLDGINVQVTDLTPNNSQKNNSLDGKGQTGYLKWSLDRPATTRVSGDAYISGSTNTEPLVAAAVDDTTGGGNDATATTVAHFGLRAYLQERVHVNPAADDDFMAPAEAVTVADAIEARVAAGSTLTVVDVNVILNAALSGVDNSLDSTDGAGGAVAGSTSFGNIEEVLAILEGRVHRTPAFTIVADAVGNWIGLTARDVLVAAQDVVANGGTTFFSQGALLVAGEAGYRPVKDTVISGYLRGSLHGGQLSVYTTTALVALNPNFAYTTGTTNSYRPRATDLSETVIPETGLFAFCVVYDAEGNLVS